VLDHRAQLEADVVVISFAAPSRLRVYRRQHDLASVRLYSDPGRAAYRAFGFQRAGVARVWLDPRVWARYAQLVARGRLPRPVHDDTLQLGGDVLADATGRVHWIHRSRGPEDRPSIDAILAARHTA
jgi:hypothetical protein